VLKGNYLLLEVADYDLQAKLRLFSVAVHSEKSLDWSKIMKSEILNRLVSQLVEKGMPRATAIGVATRKLQQFGNVDSSGRDTMQGLIRGSMSPAERAIDREIKTRGGSPNNYVYNSKTNKATKRN
jgi:hypothetical protein